MCKHEVRIDTYRFRTLLRFTVIMVIMRLYFILLVVEIVSLEHVITTAYQLHYYNNIFAHINDYPGH